MFQLLRHFAIAGLAFVLVAAAVLGGLYRTVAERSLVEVGEENNTSLTLSLANALGPTLAAYLEASRPLQTADLKNHPGLPAMHAAVLAHMRQVPVVKIKVYDLAGRTVFSTEAKQIGEDKRGNAGFQAALVGRTASELTHRDRFSAFEQVIEDRDVLSTYIPLRASGDGPVQAVFEIYSDVTPFVVKIARVQWLVSAAVLAVLLLLYAALFAVVRRAERILKAQYAEREAAEAALAATRDTLEQRVEERTNALASTNAALEAEVNERRVAEARASYLAHHDELTGLPNRVLFMERLQQAIAQAGRSGHSVAVLFLDLDRFKNINDSLGHATGDQLLKVVGALCARAVRDGDTVARSGGDEFIVCLNEVESAEQAGSVARGLLAEVARGFDIGAHKLHANASIGITLYPADGADAETLVRNADTAMYHAKDDGRGTFHFFREQMTERVKRRLALEIGLRGALDRNELVLHFQPIVALETGKLLGAEALVRWNHPERGLVSPAEFIPVAEDIGLIGQLGEWVLNEACAHAMRWTMPGGHRPFVAVNLSARQFQEGSLVAVVQAALARSGLAAPNLELEITESMLMQQTDRTVRVLHELESLGVKLAIDDFGTGYSSLGYLKRFPVSTLKIDRSFLRDVARDEDDRAIVSAVMAMARSLDLTVTAEGVERAEQVAFLRELGCDQVQGYLYSRPVPAAEFERLLQKPTLSTLSVVGGQAA
ncbi:MAG: diguanylate cyclase/phosphodiesterase with sensor [Deltaproteobacteria bacterium]|nr:diguanylate cyclase/phosphodiesterase with sensor [Deltaproteobacteria bacterium]